MFPLEEKRHKTEYLSSHYVVSYTEVKESTIYHLCLLSSSEAHEVVLIYPDSFQREGRHNTWIVNMSESSMLFRRFNSNYLVMKSWFHQLAGCMMAQRF
jgi:hypothetical protein